MAGQPKASSSSSSSSNHNTTAGSSITYDVFLNFRGEDTRKGFTGHLHRALSREGIRVFMDSCEPWEGEDIGSTLLNSIQGSKISIPVFSKGYAASKWCLKELVEIWECRTSNNQIVLPIFFDVDPSDVRHQNGSFKEAFLEHEKNVDLHIVQRWRDALSKIGNLKGWVLSEVENGCESRLVELVVERALSEVVTVPSANVTCHVGLDSRVNDLQSLLNINSKDVQYFGICGIGGIGKTTIARALYDSIVKHFHKGCFLANIREEASRDKGLVSLQEALILSISKRKVHGEILSVEIGKQMIKRRLDGEEKVVLILDDVDHHSQLDAFALKLNWLGQGSIVIITTRDEKILKMTEINEDKIYCPEQLDDEQSLQCFSLRAFKSSKPFEDYMELSRAVANYSGGLPLTLEVLGSYLFGVRNKKVWKDTIEELSLCPHKDVFERLKISYDNLESENQKAIFLDSACFFVGWNRETVVSIWEACGFCPELAIERLTQRSLLRFDDSKDGGCLRMHDQIQYMGKQIVLRESLREPSKRSRLWSHEEIRELMEENRGTDKIESIVIPTDLPIKITSEHLEMMSNLRLLISNSRSFSGDFRRLPSSLRYFRWNNCSFDIDPSIFYHKRLNHLDLSCSMIKQAWITSPEVNKFQNLKVLNLSYCGDLWDSPSFLWFPCLERLDLGYCTKLWRLDESIGELHQLKRLNLEFCDSLRELPATIGNMKSLAELKLRNVTKIEELPDGVGLLVKLEELDVSGCTSLVRVPGLSMLTNLRRLNLRGCSKLEQIQGIEGSKSLENMEARDCFKLTRTQRKIVRKGSLLLDPPVEFSYSLNGMYNEGLALCIVFEFIPNLLESEEHRLQIFYLDVSASMYQDGKAARLHHTLRIRFFHREGNIIYIHHFEGFDWFGIPLQEKDAIKNLDVRRLEILDDSKSNLRVKFWKLLFGDTEQQMLNIEEFFTGSAVGINEEEGLEIEDEVDEEEEEVLPFSGNEKILLPFTKQKVETPLQVNNSFLFRQEENNDGLPDTVEYTRVNAYFVVLFAFIACVHIFFLGPKEICFNIF